MEKFLDFTGSETSKLTKWKVKSGSSFNSGTVLFLFEPNGESVSQKMKATEVGTVTEICVKEGNQIVPGTHVMKIRGCAHPVVMKDMCAECGADLREDFGFAGDLKSSTSASIAMVHSVPELIVSEETAAELGKADEERLLKSRKLVLLVDLDETVLHTTNDTVPNNLKDVYHFQLLHGHSLLWYHTKFRPNTEKFLQKISEMYELHICTFGARMYAHTMARYLDPEGKYFSHRILSRDECFDARSKTANLKALFPRGDSMVCIIDDREEVWNFAPNMIHVKPYIFFDGTADINAPPGMDKSIKKNTGENYPSKPKRNVKIIKVPKVKQKYSETIVGSVSSDIEAGKETSDPKEINSDSVADGENTIIENMEMEKECIMDVMDTTNVRIQGDFEEQIHKNSEHLKSLGGDEKHKTENTEHVQQTSEYKLVENAAKGSGDVKKEVPNSEKLQDSDPVTQKSESLKMDVEQGITPLVSDPQEKIGNSTENISQESIISQVSVLPKKENISEKENLISQESIRSENEKNSEKESVTSEVSVASEKEDIISQVSVSSAKENVISDEHSPYVDKKVEDCGDSCMGESKEKSEQEVDNDVTYEEWIEWEDCDDYLMYLEDILTRIHGVYFDMYDKLGNKASVTKDDSPNLKKIIPYVKKKVLQGVNMVFSSVVPTNQPLEKSRAYYVAKSLGANVHTDIKAPSSDVEHTTHLVAAKLGTQKVRAAIKLKGIHIVRPDWLWTCHDRWEHVEEALFMLDEKHQFIDAQDSPDITLVKEKLKRKAEDDPANKNDDLCGKKLFKKAKISESEQDKYINENVNSVTEGKDNNIEDMDTSGVVVDEQIPSTSQRPRRFSETINPLYSFSSKDFEDMDKEVDEILSDESDSEEESKNPKSKHSAVENENYESDDSQIAEKELRRKVLTGQKDSSSEDSMSGDFPRGWKRKVSPKGDYDDNSHLLEIEDPGEANLALLKAAQSSPHWLFEDSSNSQNDSDGDSIGSVDEEMAAAVEKELFR